MSTRRTTKAKAKPRTSAAPKVAQPQARADDNTPAPVEGDAPAKPVKLAPVEGAEAPKAEKLAPVRD